VNKRSNDVYFWCFMAHRCVFKPESPAIYFIYTRGESNSPVRIQDFKWSLNSLQPIRRRPKTEKKRSSVKEPPLAASFMCAPYTEMLSVVGSAIQSALIYAGAVPDLILDPRLPAPTLYLLLLRRTQKISTCIYCARSTDEWSEREKEKETGGEHGGLHISV
jgi:hypothetical protein